MRKMILRGVMVLPLAFGVVTASGTPVSAEDIDVVIAHLEKVKQQLSRNGMATKADVRRSLEKMKNSAAYAKMSAEERKHLEDSIRACESTNLPSCCCESRKSTSKGREPKMTAAASAGKKASSGGTGVVTRVIFVPRQEARRKGGLR